MKIEEIVLKPLQCRATMKKALSSFKSKGHEIEEEPFKRVFNLRGFTPDPDFVSKLEAYLRDNPVKNEVNVINVAVAQMVEVYNGNKPIYKVGDTMSCLEKCKQHLRSNLTATSGA